MAVIQVVNAVPDHLNWLLPYDAHIDQDLLAQKITIGEILIIMEDNIPIGFLRFNLFWDNIPFMNMLWITSPYRKKGYGKTLVQSWERQMLNRGFSIVLTSTQSNEAAQHFYRKIGYQDAGALLLPKEALEIILLKQLV